MRRYFLITLLMALPLFIYGFEPIPTQRLLLSYLENDVDLQKLTLSAQKAALSLDYTKIDEGFDITLASGTVTLTSDEGSAKIKASPSVKVSLPQASNLSVKAGASLVSSAASSTAQDVSLSASLDLISTNGLSRKISLLKAERAYKEALRKLQNQSLEVEKAFYTEYKALLSSIKQIIKAEQSLYSDSIDFDSVKAQGYSSSSSTYRLAEMKVLSDKHTVESNLRSLIHDYVVFYKKCGYDISLEANQDYLELIPNDIESPQAVDVLAFDKNSYAKIEEAKWTNEINSLERKADSTFSLAANAGYTYQNSVTDSDTLDAGLSFDLAGLSLGAGLSFPVGNEASASSSPALTLSASLSPSSFKKNSIQKKQANLSEEAELLDIQSANSSYETYIVSAIQNLEGLNWEKNTINENYAMYSKLAEELESWYKMGIVTQSEYLSAKANAAMYKVEILINMLDFIIYNDEVKGNFIFENQEV